MKDPLLTEEWKGHLKEMSERTIRMRYSLKERLDRLGTPGNWNHVTDQIGMFCYSGLDGTLLYCYKIILIHIILHFRLLQLGQLKN